MLISNICIALLLLLTLLHFVAPNDSIDIAAMGEAIGRMENELAKLTNQSTNVLKRLDLLAKSGLKLMDLLAPVAKFAFGALLKALIKAHSGGGTDEAIIQLGKQMDRGFKHLEVKFQRRIDEFECREVADKYDDEVVFKLKLIFEKFQEIFDETNDEQLAKECLDAFLNGCKPLNQEDIVPILILEFIDKKIRENCKLSDMSPLQPGCKEDKDGHVPRCYLKAYRDGNQHKRQPMLDFVEQVASDMLKLQITATFCVLNLPAGHSDAYRKRQLNTVKSLVEGISGHMKMWMDKNLEAAWPGMFVQYAIEENELLKEESVKSAVENGNNQLLKGFAESIAQESRERGPIGFNYRAIIWSDLTPHRIIGGTLEVKSRTALCRNAYFCEQQFKHGMHILLSRYKEDESSVAFFDNEAFGWVQSRKREMETFLKDIPILRAPEEALQKILAKFPEIEEYFGTFLLTGQSGQALSPAEGISTNNHGEGGDQLEVVVEHFAFQIEYRNQEVIFETGQVYCEHFKLTLLAGDRPFFYEKRYIEPPQRFVLIATPKAHSPRQFKVNLICDGKEKGSGCKDGEILLHFNARFDYEWTRNEVVLNSRSASSNQEGNKWGHEQRVRAFPFSAGNKFHLEFVAKVPKDTAREGNYVEIKVNGQHLCTYVYRNQLAGKMEHSNNPTLGFQILQIQGDLEEEEMSIE